MRVGRHAEEGKEGQAVKEFPFIRMTAFALTLMFAVNGEYESVGYCILLLMIATICAELP